VPALSPRFDEAVAYASALHRTQLRKSTRIPYVSHLLSVCALALEAGADEEQAIAALLHDALEDQGHRTSASEIARRFGDRVARIVVACSDTDDDYLPWRSRKEEYLEHLESAPEEVLLVSRADKLHNARAILIDLREHGETMWRRFHAGPAQQLWYYRSLADVFSRRLPGQQSDELVRTVDAIAEETGQRWSITG
jgi:(p)ppGpp synthase/HD superfamily hydrolase